MNEEQHIVEDTIAKCVEAAYKLTPSSKTDMFINAVQAVRYPIDPVRTVEACNSLLLMFEAIRSTRCYNYSYIHGAHVANVQRAWFEIVCGHGLLRRTGAGSIFSVLEAGPRGASIAEHVSDYVDGLVMANTRFTNGVKAQLHRALITAPDGVSKVDTNEAIRVLSWVMRLWINIPGYIVEYHGLFQEVYKTYEDLVVEDFDANSKKKPSATQNADDIDDP